MQLVIIDLFIITIIICIFFFKLLAGSQVNALDKQRQTPLHVATVEDKAAILEVLLQNGANPDLVDVNLNNGKSFFFFFVE